MKQYKFDKPLVETTLPVRDTRAYYVDVDEQTGELANIMEFKNNQWQIKHFVDDISLWECSSERLGIPNKIRLNPNGIITAWLTSSDFEEKVKAAADDFSDILGDLTDLFTVIRQSITSLNGVEEDIVDSNAATTVSTVADNLSIQLSRLTDGDALEYLGALNAAINGTNEE